MAKRNIIRGKSLSARKVARRAARRAEARAAVRAKVRATRIKRYNILINLKDSGKVCIHNEVVLEKNRCLIPAPTPPRRKPGRGGS